MTRQLRGTVHCIECKRREKLVEELEAALGQSRCNERKLLQLRDGDIEKLCKAAVFCIRKWLGGDRMTDQHIYTELMKALPDWYKERERAGLKGLAERGES